MSLTDTQYYNIIINPNTLDTNRNDAVYVQQNTQDILTNPNQYLLSVDRFSIPTSYVPLAIMQPLSPSTNTLVYKLTMEYAGITTNANVVFTPVNENVSPSDDEYYFIYTYSTFIKMLNKTLSDLTTTLKVLGNPALATLTAPFFTYDSTSGIISLCAQKLFFDETLPFPISIYGNNALLQYVDSFELHYLSDVNSESKAFRWSIYQKYNNTCAFDNTLFQMYVDYTLFSPWCALKTIEMCLYGIPINYEFINHVVNAATTASIPILADFLVLYNESSVASQARSSVDYSTTERRYIEIISAAELRAIQVVVYWVDNTGVRRPLQFQNFEKALIKIMFKRKDLNY